MSGSPLSSCAVTVVVSVLLVFGVVWSMVAESTTGGTLSAAATVQVNVSVASGVAPSRTVTDTL